MCFCSSLLTSVATAKGIIHGLGFARWTFGRRMGGCFLAGPPAFASVSDTRGGGGGGRLPGFPKYRGSVTKRFFVTLGFFPSEHFRHLRVWHVIIRGGGRGEGCNPKAN